MTNWFHIDFIQATKVRCLLFFLIDIMIRSSPNQPFTCFCGVPFECVTSFVGKKNCVSSFKWNKRKWSNKENLILKAFTNQPITKAFLNLLKKRLVIANPYSWKFLQNVQYPLLPWVSFDLEI